MVKLFLIIFLEGLEIYSFIIFSVIDEYTPEVTEPSRIHKAAQTLLLS